MFLLLGDLGFGRLTSPESMESRGAVCYPALQVIEGKPLLQFIGEELEELRLSFYFHADFCSPQEIWDGIVELAASHKAFPILQGNGLLLGRYVIERRTRNTTYTADDGTLYAFECTLELREYVDPEPLETKKKEQQAQAPARKRAGKKPKASVKKQELPQMPEESKQAGEALSLDVQTVASHATRQDLSAAASH